MARSALFHHLEQTGRADVPLLVSIASPWGGNEAAGQAPGFIRRDLPPSFRDMAPSSTFLSGLFYEDPETRSRPRRLPPDVHYELWFARDDQTVPGHSSLRSAALEDAGWRTRPLPGGHADVIASPKAAEFLREALAEALD